jgi:hypothetical protein
MQDKVFFPQIWCLSMWGHLKFVCKVPKWNVLSQTKACTAKLSSVEKKKQHSVAFLVVICEHYKSLVIPVK